MSDLQARAFGLIVVGIELALEGLGHVEQDTGESSLPDVRDILQRTSMAAYALAEHLGVEVDRHDL